MIDQFNIELVSDKDTPEHVVISSESTDIENLFKIDEREAFEYGEAVYQILEGCSYEFSLPERFRFSDIPGIIKTSRLNPCSGRLTPGNFVGTLKLDIINESEGSKSQLLLEVQSIKTTYRSDYRYMLEYITNACIDLIMQHTSPVSQTYTADYSKNSKTIYQRFAFVKSIIDSEEFNQAVHRIITNPVKGWVVIDEESDIRRLKKLNYNQIRQLVSKKDRINIPAGSSLRKLQYFNSLPRKIKTQTKTETVDIPENRFIKYVLENFFSFCSQVCHLLEESHPKTYYEALILEVKLGNFLNRASSREFPLRQHFH